MLQIVVGAMPGGGVDETSVDNLSRQPAAKPRKSTHADRRRPHRQTGSAKEALSNQFKSLANDILEEKAKRFTEQNQVNIGQLLNPLKERMSEFKSKVEEIHPKDTEQQAALRAELGQLKDLNRQMTEEAHGLANALKGQAKKQGNWGELVLGNVLDRSGLREGQDFKREVSFNTEEGRKRPDVIIYLPQGKHLVIDAKVSLNA
jgi:DNA recombination protein RmuC